jgi:uncharacterized membrane protein
VRDLVQPGTSVLFIVTEEITLDKTTQAWSKFGGTVLKSSLSKDAEVQLQNTLHGTSQTVPA